MKNLRWPWNRIDHLFDIDAGKTMSARARNGQRKTPFLRTSNVLWDEIDLSVLDSMEIPVAELKKKTLHSGDLLVCEGGDIGRSAIWSGQLDTVSFQNHLHRLRPRRSDVEPHFYVYFLQAAFTQLGLFEGAGNRTTIPNLSRNRLAELEVPHPELSEQLAIANVLRSIRTAIRNQRYVVEKAQELKTVAMSDLFTNGLRGEPLRDTDIGPVPESWNLDRLGSHFAVASGGTPSRETKEYWIDGTIPWVKTTEVNYREITTTEERITRIGLEHSAAKLLPVGTVLMAMYGQGVTRGRVAVLGIEAACNQACAVMTPLGDDVSPRLLYHFLSYRYEQIRRMAHGGQQQNLNLDIVRELPLLVMKSDEQHEIISIIDAIDQKIDLHKRKKAILDELFQTLLNNLMIGEVRVSDLDLSALEIAPMAEAMA